MNRRRFTGLVGVMAASVPLLGGWLQGKGKPQTDRELKGLGYIVTVDLAPGASEKNSLKGITDAGNQIISTARLTARSGSLSSYGGGTKMSFPRWVRVTWRAPFEVEDLKLGEDPWTKGAIIGEYTVEILSRIPEEVFEYAFAKSGRAIRLKFRIKDDGVLLGWDVQEMDLKKKSIDYAMAGGDFLDEDAGPFANKKKKQE